MRCRNGLTLSLLTLVLAACATARMEAQWSDPQLLGKPAAGGKVYVSCTAVEQTVRRICQDKLAAQVSALGATPVQAGDETGNERLLAAARSAGAELLIVANIGQVTTTTNRGPAFGIGIGGGSGGFGTGVGMTLPVGSGRQDTTTSYVSDTSLTQIGTGKLVWSGKASTTEIEVADQLAQLMKVTIEAAHKASAM